MAIEEFRVRTGQSFKPILRFRPGKLRARSEQGSWVVLVIMAELKELEDELEERAATSRNCETGGVVVFETAGNGLCESAARNGMMGVELQFTSW
ncbi:hypothetical protein C5167_000996 [Papaver somniferum]|uniref:Uncharacterized protein n=1 Tax=Papaver somniferum TaxID=3469 RepID=A0A4Y7KWW0_PAPSO|nr:hypothetical protein C5167_000996 [Papaver somniferum]